MFSPRITFKNGVFGITTLFPISITGKGKGLAEFLTLRLMEYGAHPKYPAISEGISISFGRASISSKVLGLDIITSFGYNKYAIFSFAASRYPTPGGGFFSCGHENPSISSSSISRCSSVVSVVRSLKPTRAVCTISRSSFSSAQSMPPSLCLRYSKGFPPFRGELNSHGV